MIVRVRRYYTLRIRPRDHVHWRHPPMDHSSGRLTRRRTLRLVGGGLGCLSLATACALQGRTSSGSTSSAALPATRGGVVVYGQSALISNTLPYPSSASTNLFKWAIFNPLVSLDDRKQPAPVLAESW